MEITVNVSKVLKHLLSILERNWTIFNVHINLHSFLFPRYLDLWGYIWTIKICCSKSIIAVGLTYRVRIREFVGRNLYTMGLPLMNTQKFCVICLMYYTDTITCSRDLRVKCSSKIGKYGSWCGWFKQAISFYPSSFDKVWLDGIVRPKLETAVEKYQKQDWFVYFAGRNNTSPIK